MIRIARYSWAAAALLLTPAPVLAHLASSGFGPVYDGIYHFMLSPDEILGAAVLALYGGLRGPAHARILLFTLPAAWIMGAIIGLPGLPEPVESALTALSLLAFGSALAADLALPREWLACAAVFWGEWHGSTDAASFVLDGPAILPVIGGAATVFVLIALAASLALPLKQLWALIMIRVAGSWAAALGLLLAGWSIHAARLSVH